MSLVSPVGTRLFQFSDAIADIGQEEPFDHALEGLPLLGFWRFLDGLTQCRQGRI